MTDSGRPGRPLVLGIVNVTPDSFSDGGAWPDPQAAIAHGLDLAALGADIVDVGGESTRPGSTRPSEAEELDRVLPVVAALAGRGLPVSIDTMRAGVAQACLDAGARIVNDVSGGLADPDLPAVVADSPATYVAMHWRGHGDTMDDLAQYEDVVADVVAELAARVRALGAAGLPPERIVLDPGLGFAKTAAHNWAILADLPALLALGHPVLVGASRKRFLGTLPGRRGGPGADPTPPRQRDAATAATSVLAAQAGAWGVRVHDVASTVAAFDVLDAVRDAGADVAR